MRNVKLLWGIIGLLFIAILCLAIVSIQRKIPQPGGDDQTGQSPGNGQTQIAVVGSRVITEQDLQTSLYQKYGKEMLKMMLDREVIRLEGEHLGVKVERSQIDQELKRMQQGYESEANFYKAMQDQLNLSKEELREDVYYKILLETIAIKGIRIPDSAVDEYMLIHQEEFRKPAKLRIQQIIVGTKDQANKLVDDVNKGADFTQLAKDRSLDDATRNSGGDLGWIEENDPFVSTVLLKAAKELKAGQISKPFELDGKFAVVKVKERKDTAEEPKEGLRERIRRDLALHEAPPLTDFVNKLREKWQVQIWSPELAG
jgi:foldase protein PrsA